MSSSKRKCKVVAAMLVAGAAMALGIGPVSTAQAASLSTSGVTVTWDESTMYFPNSCSRYRFNYVNGSSSRLLRIGLDLLSPYGDVIAWESQVGIDSGVSGVWNMQICNYKVEDFGRGPYTLTLSVKTYGGSVQEVSTPFSFAPRPSVPGTPTNVVATPGDGEATITWSASTPGSTPTTDYIVTSSPGDLTCVTTMLTCTIDGLTNGVSYTFVAQARNSVGTSFRSFRSDPVVPGRVPTEPRGVSASAGKNQVTVSWLEPLDTGGFDTLDYIVTSTPGDRTCQTQKRSCTIKGLTAGVSYTFTVVAKNLRGMSTPSLPSGAVIPEQLIRTPDGVTKLKAIRRPGSIIVTWAPPRNLGGASTVTYRYRVDSQPWRSTSERRITVEGDRRESFLISVVAVNEAGTGPMKYIVARTR